MDKTPLDVIFGAVHLICEAGMIGDWLLDVLFRKPLDYLPFYVLLPGATGALATIAIPEKHKVGVWSTRWKRFFFFFFPLLIVLVARL